MFGALRHVMSGSQSKVMQDMMSIDWPFLPDKQHKSRPRHGISHSCAANIPVALTCQSCRAKQWRTLCGQCLALRKIFAMSDVCSVQVRGEHQGYVKRACWQCQASMVAHVTCHMQGLQVCKYSSTPLSICRSAD